MNKQLELEQEAKYLRLIDGKVVEITESEALAEEVLTAAGDRLGEWVRFVQEAEQTKQRISFIHKMMTDDERRPSRYRVDYDMLWYQYQEIIGRLREINPESVDQFRDKVVTRVRELEVRLNAICDNYDPSDFDDFEDLLALYEKTFDLMAFLVGG